MCATASTVIDTIKSENLLENAGTIGDYLLDGFRNKIGQLDAVTEIRGLGMMIGIELNCDLLKSACPELVRLALEKNLLINVTANKVVRLLPPLIINQQQANTIIDTVSDVIISSLQKAAA